MRRTIACRPPGRRQNRPHHAPGGLLLITVHPNPIAPAALAAVAVIIAVGGTRADHRVLLRSAGAITTPTPVILEPGKRWFGHDMPPTPSPAERPGRTQRRRHQRKDAEGDLGVDKSVYVRGPQGALNLRAQTLHLF